VAAFLAVVVAGAALAACGDGATTAHKQGAAARGGSLRVLENSGAFGTWPSLDPLNPSAAAESVYLNAIFGTLFRQGPDGKVIPDLASAYHYSEDGMTFTVTLRDGVRFTDGTPLDAQAVAFNLRRDLDPKNACLCVTNFPVASVDAPDTHTVVLHLTRVFAPLKDAFFGASPNWVASPTALQQMGDQAFGLKPVGAGPFKVKSNQPSAVLVLERNPDYFEKGKPLLDSLTFSVVGSDESAYAALLAGQADVYQGYSTFASIDTVKKQVRVTELPSSIGPFNIQLNTAVAPFDNQLAREAIYYATDPGPILKAVAAGRGDLTQSPTIPGGLYYEPTVPGYRTHDLEKAKALVRRLGGLTVNLETIRVQSSELVATALKAQWEQAGIKVNFTSEPLQGLIQTFHSGGWQAMLQTAGGFNPALGTGLAFRYVSDGPFSGVHDPHLDTLVAKGAASVDPKAQDQVYREIWKYLSDKAYSPFLFSTPGYTLSAHRVAGPGISSPGYQVVWSEVSMG
jgi:peptide/nickel transport system substrate-binding protein